jgi:peroxiredoxin
MNEFEPWDNNNDYDYYENASKGKNKRRWGVILAILISLATCAFVLMIRSSRLPVIQTVESNINEIVVVHTATSGPPPEGVEIGFMAPDFTLKTIDGESITLSSLRGKVVLLNFWATWCPPCQEEMPAFQNIHEEFKDDSFIIISITTEAGSEMDNVIAFRENYNLTFSILLDENGSVNQRYYVDALPRTLLITTDGVINKILLGAVTEDGLRQELSAILP